METLPEPQDPIKSLLSWFMSEEDVALYSDLPYVLDTIRKRELCWQAAVSNGVHAFELRGKRDEEQARVENLVSSALEPLEALLESLTQQASQQPLTDEQGRMLLHVRFGLGWLLWLKGDQERSKSTLHDMAATNLSWSRRWSRSGGDIVPYTDDLARAKQLTAIFMSILYCEAEDYDEGLYLIEQAADTPESGELLLGMAGGLLERWAAKCERTEDEEGEDTWYDWMILLNRVGGILSVCSYTDTSSAAPGECDKTSAQFFAYKFGQLAARFAVRMAGDWPGYITQEDQERLPADYLLHALLCEHAVCSDWQKAREAFTAWWELTPRYSGIPAEEIGPHTDLYWAMRIGFADKMQESTETLVPTVSPPAATERMQTIQDIATATLLHLIKQQHEQDKSRPPTEQELRLFLKERLGTVWDNLPSDVTDPLISAEYGYRSGWQSSIPTGAVLKGFHEAVQACFEWYFEIPFARYLNKGHVSHTMVCSSVWRGEPQLEKFYADKPRCLSIGKWAGVFRVAAAADVSDNKNLQVRTFLKQNWPNLDDDALRRLAASLGKVRGFRNREEHPDSAPTPHHVERAELGDMRGLVLGTADSPSVISLIYDLFAPSKQP